MFRQASVADVIEGRVTRSQGRVVVAMRTYPRPLKKGLRDEYLVDLSPEPELFREFKDAERRLGDHDAAFEAVDYETRFSVSSSAMIELERLARDAEEQDVWLVCQCAVGQRCHRELLLMIARHALAAEAESPPHEYPRFAARLAKAPSLVGRPPSRYP